LKQTFLKPGLNLELERSRTISAIVMECASSRSSNSKSDAARIASDAQVLAIPIRLTMARMVGVFSIER
jgi:hypothetical protein